jgi:hypothetical protein
VTSSTPRRRNGDRSLENLPFAFEELGVAVASLMEISTPSFVIFGAFPGSVGSYVRVVTDACTFVDDEPSSVDGPVVEGSVVDGSSVELDLVLLRRRFYTCLIALEGMVIIV